MGEEHINNPPKSVYVWVCVCAHVRVCVCVINNQHSCMMYVLYRNSCNSTSHWYLISYLSSVLQIMMWNASALSISLWHSGQWLCPHHSREMWVKRSEGEVKHSKDFSSDSPLSRYPVLFQYTQPLLNDDEGQKARQTSRSSVGTRQRPAATVTGAADWGN